MENEYKQRNDVHSVTLRAGKKRTYFFDVRTTKNNDYFLTITESKRQEGEGYERHKIFLYKEDFMRFLTSLQDTIDYVKTELLPDYDFDNPSYRDGEEPDYNND